MEPDFQAIENKSQRVCLRFSLMKCGEFIALLALIAAACRFSPLFILAIPLTSWRLTRFWEIPNKSSLAVWLSIYLPGCIGLFADCSHCRETWWRVWAIIPGIAGVELARVIGQFSRPDDTVQFGIAGFLTLALGIGATFLASIGPKTRTGVVIALVGLSGFLSWAIASAIRM